MSSINVLSVPELLTIGTLSLSDGDVVTTLSYHEPSFTSAPGFYVGGNMYVWDSARPKADHDGGTIISPTVPWNGTIGGIANFLDGVGETQPSGTGCFVMRSPLEVFVEQYGALGDNSTSDWKSFDRAIHRKLRYLSGEQNHAGIIRLRDAFYYLDDTLNIKSSVEIAGAYSNMTSRKQVILRFANDKSGLVIHRDDTVPGGTVDPPTVDGRGAYLHGFVVQGDGTSQDAHGIHYRAQALVENVHVLDFPGNGINIVATATSGDPTRVGNANGWALDKVKVQECAGHGVYVDGADVNAGHANVVDVSKCGGVGIYDSSFLGNTWVACHTATNQGGCYLVDNDNARSVLFGCYSEGGQGPAILAKNSLSIGGLHAEGVSGQGGDGGSQVWRKTMTRDYMVAAAGGSSGYYEHIIAHNEAQTFISQREAWMVGKVGYKEPNDQGVTPRPAGGICFRPQSSDRAHRGVIDFGVYDGSGTDQMVKVAHFWGLNDFSPENDALTDLGWSGGAWRNAYLDSAPIITSDEREKESVRPLTDAEERVSANLRSLVRAYRKSDQVKKKGDSARVHFGVMAQHVVKAFADEGLDAFRYGIVCHETWTDEGGSVLGERYAVRYEELMAFIIATL